MSHRYLDKIIKLEGLISAIKEKIDSLPSDPASNSLVNTRATLSSINSLQSTVDAVKAHTGLIPRILLLIRMLTLQFLKPRTALLDKMR
jgi:hypothetical protein